MRGRRGSRGEDEGGRGGEAGESMEEESVVGTAVENKFLSFSFFFFVFISLGNVMQTAITFGHRRLPDQNLTPIFLGFVSLVIEPYVRRERERVNLEPAYRDCVLYVMR